MHWSPHKFFNKNRFSRLVENGLNCECKLSSYVSMYYSFTHTFVKVFLFQNMFSPCFLFSKRWLGVEIVFGFGLFLHSLTKVNDESCIVPSESISKAFKSYFWNPFRLVLPLKWLVESINSFLMLWNRVDLFA